MAFRLRERNVNAALAAIPGSRAARERLPLCDGCMDSECCAQHPGFEGESSKVPNAFFPPAGMSNTRARKLLVEAGILPPK